MATGDVTTFRPEWDVATYAAAEAGRLVGLSADRVRRWLRGYDYRYDSRIQHQKPVVHRRGTAGTTYASFLDLIDLLFVKRFLDHGVSLQKVRKALDEASEILETDHFARQTFFADAGQIYVKVKDEGDAILQLLSRGQWVIAPVIRELTAQIEFDHPTGLARRWYPMGPDGLVVLDPLVSFGRPTVTNRGVATANVYDFFIAERRQLDSVCSWMSLDRREVEAAVHFEEQLVA